ncbi:MAG: apolipoprotein N-acyltransferase [Bryobacteraceae bacterium]|nr:apolipoprotein N-acyltransferase [Bryobacteraceae bacterium]MDW8380218.1 apolipoprotein N-acyltransferase [Bryobacterales bacterium]
MKPLLLALVSAVLTILVFPRFELTWLAGVCLAPLILACAHEARPAVRLGFGWAAGIVYWCGVCYWIQPVLANYASMSQPLAWFTFLLFGIGKGVHWAVFCWAAGYLVPASWAVPAVAALWTGIERTNAISFVWLPLGNAGLEMGIPMRLAPLVGVSGLSFVFATMNVAVALLLLRRPRRHLLPLAGLLFLFLLPELPEAEKPAATAVLIQPNIEERQEWTAEFTEHTIRSLALLSLEHATEDRSKPAEVIVWPEVPAPFYFTDPMFRDQAEQLARVTQTSFLFGAVGRHPSGAPTNSAFMVGPDGNFVARYDKVNLVPFGEFVPSGFWWIEKISSESGNFVAGSRRVLFPSRQGSLGVFICYESAFPNFVRQFVADGAQVLVNLSNDGYFGRSAAREQHLWLARMRAAENRRWLIRATNDGISAVIDPAGRLAQQFAPLKRLSAKARFSYRSDQTPFSKYGDWFAWSCLVAGALSGVLSCRWRPS